VPHFQQAAPAMKWVSRQQAGQRPCGASVGSGQVRQRGGKIASITATQAAEHGAGRPITRLGA
jgi:hypothetical protein